MTVPAIASQKWTSTSLAECMAGFFHSQGTAA